MSAAPARTFSIDVRQPKALASFYLSLAELLDAGVPVTVALAQAATQLPGARGLDAHVELGNTLSQALSLAPAVFPAPHLRLIAAGEAGGRSPAVLRQLAVFAEEFDRMSGRIRSGLALPAMVFHFGAIIAPLPALFRGGTLAGYFSAAFGPIVAVWLVVIAAVMIGQRLSPAARDRLMKSLPWFRTLWRELDVWWFLSAMEILTNAGVGVIASLRECATSCRSAAMAGVLRRAADAAESRGEPVSVMLKASGEFPPDLIARWQTGERSGSLDRMLGHAARDYGRRVAARLDTLAEWAPRVIYALVAIFLIGKIFAGAPVLTF